MMSVGTFLGPSPNYREGKRDKAPRKLWPLKHQWVMSTSFSWVGGRGSDMPSAMGKGLDTLPLSPDLELSTSPLDCSGPHPHGKAVSMEPSVSPAILLVG